MVLNMRIYNPGKHSAFISRQRETRDGILRGIIFPGHRPLYLYAADCKSAETDTETDTAETSRNDRHGKHTPSQVGNPVPRSTGHYFAGSTRVLAAEYADALRTACPRSPQFAPPYSSASYSFCSRSIVHVPSDTFHPPFHRICNPMVLNSRPLKSAYLRDISQKQYLADIFNKRQKSPHGSFEVVCGGS